MTDIGHVVTSFEPDGKLIAKALKTDDDVGAVIRCHFEAERSARHALSSIAPRRYRSERFRYLSNLLDGLELIGVHSNFIKPLRIINSIRNNFAHHGKDEILDDDVTELFGAVKLFYPSFGDEFKFTFKDAVQIELRYATSTNKEKFIIMSVLASSMLAAIPDIQARVWKVPD